MTLSSIKAGMSMAGVEPELIVSVVAALPVSESALTLVYRLPDGSIKERLLTEADCKSISEAVTAHPWRFDGDGEAFKLAVEAKRIDLAFLFDPMMAVHTSNVDPLPHQITAVYESMLPRQPLRFVLADDPGAGKTIMAGLYIRELIMRSTPETGFFVVRSAALSSNGATSCMKSSVCSSMSFPTHWKLLPRVEMLSMTMIT